jgi:hypothetical protein
MTEHTDKSIFFLFIYFLAERRMKVHTLNSKHYALVFEHSDTSKEPQMG